MYMNFMTIENYSEHIFTICFAFQRFSIVMKFVVSRIKCLIHVNCMKSVAHVTCDSEFVQTLLRSR